MRKPVLFILFLFFTIMVLSFVQVSVSNGLSTAGITLSNYEKEVKEYKKENGILSEQILEESSLTNLSKQAEQQGFIENKAGVFVLAPVPVALKQ